MEVPQSDTAFGGSGFLAVLLACAALCAGLALILPPRNDKLASTERFMFGGVFVFIALLTAGLQALGPSHSSGRRAVLVLLFVAAPIAFGLITLTRSRWRPGRGSGFFAGAIALLFALAVGAFYAVWWSLGNRT